MTAVMQTLRRPRVGRMVSWIAAIALIGQAAIAAFYMPLRETLIAEQTQTAGSDSISKLVADLQYLCTPLGVQTTGSRTNDGKGGQAPATTGCPVCTLLAHFGIYLPPMLPSLLLPILLVGGMVAAWLVPTRIQSVTHTPQARAPPASH